MAYTISLARSIPRNRRARPHRLLRRLALFSLTGSALLFGQIETARAVEKLVASECGQCHGSDGTSVAPTFPNIGGLDAGYIAKQLREFARAAPPGTGSARLPPGPGIPRPSDVMTPIAAKLTGAQIDALARHFSQQRRVLGTVYNPGMAELGRRVYTQGNRESGLPACAGCHRPDGSGTHLNPMLAGQNSAYVLAQLRAFKRDERNNDRGMLMRTTAGRMTEQEMIAVSEYVAGLPQLAAGPNEP